MWRDSLDVSEYSCFMVQKSGKRTQFSGKVVTLFHVYPIIRNGFLMTIQNAGFLSGILNHPWVVFKMPLSTEERDNIPSFQHAMWLSIITMTSATWPTEVVWKLSGIRFIFSESQEWLFCKSNIDTKNGYSLKEPTFSKPSFWVSMLVFGDVHSGKKTTWTNCRVNITFRGCSLSLNVSLNHIDGCWRNLQKQALHCHN